jgi:hypothetical protein
VCEPGWVIVDKTWTSVDNNGVHGYDPNHEDMGAIFVARGPRLRKRNETIPAFANVELYTLIFELLNAIPNANNGTGILSKEILYN